MLAKILTPENPAHDASHVHFPNRRKILLDIENKTSQLLTLSDYVPVRVALATYGANFLNQVPLWMMMVAPPSSGKTEMLGSLYKLQHTEVVSDLTKSSLLSGTAKKEIDKNATGGILTKLGKFGFLIFKDMTSLLSKNKDAASEIFGAFREIYDGDYSRHFGNDGGTQKEWHGRLGLISAVTSEIEKHRSAFSAMGDRFLTVRIYNSDDIKMEQARAAMRHSGTENRIRLQLQELTKQLFQDFVPNTELGIDSLFYIENFIVPLAAFVAVCRTPVDRSAYTRDSEFVHTTEGYARLAKQLYGLFCGCIVTGCSLAEAWRFTLRVGLDTIPEQRAQVLKSILDYEQETGQSVFTLKELRSETRLSLSANRRIIDELYSVSVLNCSHGAGRSSSTFWLTEKTKELIDSISLLPEEPVCIPENLNDPIPTNTHKEKRENKETEVEDAS